MRTASSMTQAMSDTYTTPSPRRARRPSGLRAVVLGTVIAALLSLQSTPARAELYTGLDAAFTMDTLFGVGSLVAIGGNAVTLATGKPSRGFMYAGFVFGFINTVMSPIIIVYGRGDIEKVPAGMGGFMHGPERPEIGYGLGLAHGVLGITSLALSIRNAVVWHRQRVAESMTPPEPVASRTFSSLQLLPVLSRDSRGSALYGVVLSGQM